MAVSVQQRRWKGKERARYVELDDRDEGGGGEGGVVLSLTLVGNGVYDAVYTIPVKIGNKGQQFSLQVDTGSSDLWIASTSCSSSACSQTKGQLYDPGGATQTGVDFSIPYLSGSAVGPIVWDNVTIGGYTIDSQALAAANDVQNESLEPNFSGILGLALPLNSIIASDIPPVTNNNPDGAAWASNLFSITPTSASPSSRFLSLALSRPGSDQVPAVFGIGRHPASLVPNPSLVQYSTPVSDRPGTLFWKVSVRAITVYVNGTTKRIQLGPSVTRAPFPTAVLDSGVSLILTTSNIANGIYGAIGISPASDGMYYVPCTTPLNMTITLDNRPEIPLHPLDLTAEPPQDNQAQFCIGLIQTVDPALSNPNSALGDMILGVPFLRNVYTVMAYTTPNADGSFTAMPTNDSNQTITPRIGLLALTNSTIALEEFNTVRVLNRPISGGGGGSGGGSSGSNGSANPTVNLGGKKLSVGIVVLIGLLSFFALCCVLFVVRWFTFRRKFREIGTTTMAGMQGDDVYGGVGGKKNSTTTDEVYILSKTKTMSSSKDEKSSMGDDPYLGTGTKAEEEAEAGRVGERTLGDSAVGKAVVDNGEFGEKGALGRGRGVRDVEASGDNTLVRYQGGPNANALYPVEEPDLSIPSSSSSSSSTSSSSSSNSNSDHATYNTPPLPPNDETYGEMDGFGVSGNYVRTSMAGIGTASRTRQIDLDSSFLRGVDRNRNSGVVKVIGGDGRDGNGLEPELTTRT